MTIPKDTWISVKDAMPDPNYNKIELELLICLNDGKNQHALAADFNQAINYSDLGVFTHWMLLSKPKTTN